MFICLMVSPVNLTFMSNSFRKPFLPVHWVFIGLEIPTPGSSLSGMEVPMGIKLGIWWQAKEKTKSGPCLGRVSS